MEIIYFVQLRIAKVNCVLLRELISTWLSVLPLLSVLFPVAAALVAPFGRVGTADAVLFGAVGRLLGYRADVVGVLQLVDLLACTVQCHDFAHARHGSRGDIDHRILARREGHRTGEDVALDEEIFAVDGLQRFAQARELLAGVDIGVVFVHHIAALELRALSGQFLGIERNVLARARRRS